MSARRNALGRGLGALIPGPAPGAGLAPQPPGGEAASGGAAEIPVSAIEPNPEQPRRVFEPEELERLAESIRLHGILQPVVVRPIPSSTPQRYELLVGERRWRASKLAGRETIPATVQHVDSEARLEIALVENLQRKDLNPIEMAHAFRALLEGGATQEAVGTAVGLDRSTVANHLRLLDLPRELQGDVEGGRLSMGHAKAVLQVSNPERRRRMRDRIVREGLSVRAAEDLARSLAAPGTPDRRASRSASRAADPNLQHLIDELRSHLQTRVRISGDGRRGRIEIEFFGAEDLHRISRSILEGARS